MADGVLKITLVGKMDLAGAQQIDLRFNALSGGHLKVIVDLSGVIFLASMGLRTLIMGAKTVNKKGGKLVLLNPTPDVEQVLVASGVDDLMPVCHDFAVAHEKLSQ